jgi:hypothetical protein
MENEPEVSTVPRDYHFYRCEVCKNILTRDDEMNAFKSGEFCDCGGMRYRPTNPLDHEWGKPKVQEYCRKNDLTRPPDETEELG